LFLQQRLDELKFTDLSNADLFEKLSCQLLLGLALAALIEGGVNAWHYSRVLPFFVRKIAVFPKRQRTVVQPDYATVRQLLKLMLSISIIGKYRIALLEPFDRLPLQPLQEVLFRVAPVAVACCA